MAFLLRNIFEDGRLERLFSKSNRNCALQLWILQIKSEDQIRNQVIYGRLLPYNHASNTWYMTENDNFKLFGSDQIQIIRLNLYLQSSNTQELLQCLSEGKNLIDISAKLNLKLSPQHSVRVGTTSIALPVVYRPVAYLLNHDAPSLSGPLSPHGSAGAFSASISQFDKNKFFQVGENFDSDLATFIINQLNSQTGLSFGDKDLYRIGDIELLVFPTLDDHERELLSVGRNLQSGAFNVKLNTIQLPHYKRFMVRLSLSNDNQIVHSGLSTAVNIENNKIEYEFEVPEQLQPIIDCSEVEIYGLGNTDTEVAILCCRWKIAYVREISINSHLVGNQSSSVRLDWLERVTNSKSASQRLQAAQTINQGNLGFSSSIGDRKSDMWVPVNRELRSLLAKLSPSRSEGRFFDRLSDGDGLGRLEFVEWIKKLLIENQNHQVLIFDPYFEDAGIGLIVPNAGNNGDYIVFTTLPKPPKQEITRWYSPILRFLKKFGGQEDSPPPNNRINNLLASCEQLKSLLRGVRLRVYGLNPGDLHDRYILIVDPDGLPVSGFNLSNSIQKANENYPLLITPIPADVLLKVLKYAMEVLNQTFLESSDDKKNTSKAQLIFDSKSAKDGPRKHFERLSFLNNDLAGDVLAGWTGELSLEGLTGDILRQKMSRLGLLESESLTLKDDFQRLKKYLAHQSLSYNSFRGKWLVIGDILANTHTGDIIQTAEFSTEPIVLNFLSQFLSESFSRAHTKEVDAPIAFINTSHFKDSIDVLIATSYEPYHFCHHVKFAALSWAEFYAIKILWIYDSDALLKIAESQAETIPNEDQAIITVKLSLLSQIISEVALSVEFGLNHTQRHRLINSSNGLLKWMGLNALEAQIKNPDDVQHVVKYLSCFDRSAKIQILGWMTNRRAEKQPEIFSLLVNSLHAALPDRIIATDAKHLVDSLRGHMHKLGWCEPWLFQNVINPLLINDRVTPNDLCNIWIKDLQDYLQGTLKDQIVIFDRNREGLVTKIAAFLFANSTISKQEATLKAFKKILDGVSRDVKQPLASTQNWRKWDTSLGVAMWIFAFTSWANQFLARPSQIEAKLGIQLNEARDIALARPITEWKSERKSSSSELAHIIKEVGCV